MLATPRAMRKATPELLAVSAQDVFREDTSWGDGLSTWLLHCPVCGFDYTHPVGAFTRVGSDAYEAGVYAGTEARGVTGLRRSAIVVEFSCEGGCRFHLVIQQHKGQNFVAMERLPSGPARQGVHDPLPGMQEAEKLEAQARLLELKAERLRDQARQVPGLPA